MNIIALEDRCFNCNEQLTEENYNGWFEIQLNEFGIEMKVKICNACNLNDDGSERNGAY